MSDQSALVSVIIIFLNESRFLDQAVESVYAQGYSSWELLLVDDGSTDGSSDIARRWSEREPQRIRYLEHANHANRGPSASRNLGAAHARGEFLAFLDGDDIWLPARLSRGVALMRQHPNAAMVYGASQYWRSWDAASSTNLDRIQPHGFRTNRLVDPPELLIRFWSHRAAIPCVNSLLVRRDAYEAVGGYESSFRSVWEDQVFLVKFCLRHPVFVANECWDRYRQHAQSSCARAEAGGHLLAQQGEFFDWCEDYVRRSSSSGTDVLKALDHARQRAVQPRRSLRGKITRVVDRMVWSRYGVTETTAP